MEIGATLPSATLPIFAGSADGAKKVQERGRLAHDGENVACPSLPEADNQFDAYNAFMRFKDWLLHPRASKWLLCAKRRETQNDPARRSHRGGCEGVMFSVQVQLRMYLALKRISQYQIVESLHRNSRRDYGCTGLEAIEMAYENLVWEARASVKGIRKPKVPP